MRFAVKTQLEELKKLLRARMQHSTDPAADGTTERYLSANDKAERAVPEEARRRHYHTRGVNPGRCNCSTMTQAITTRAA